MGRLELTKKINELISTLKDKGIKYTFKKYGWKLFLVVFCYYLVRDVFLYIIVPFWAAQRLLK